MSNEIQSLPDLAPSASLNKLFVSKNRLTSLPSALPPSLEILHAADNSLRGELAPGLLAALPKLKFIHLAHNRLESFAFAELETNTELRVLELDGNPCTETQREPLEEAMARLKKSWSFEGRGSSVV